MDSQENKDRGLDNLELPAAKKICLDGNDVSNSFRNNSSLSDSTLHLGYLFSPRQSLSSCSTNDGVSNSTFSSPIHRINISDGNNTAEGENKVFTFATSEANDKSNVSTVMSDFNKASECVNIEDNDKEKCSLDNNDVSNSFRNNSSLSDSTLHLGKLFSSKQSLDSCSTNGGDSNSTTEEENKVFTTSETDDKSVVSSAISDLNKASECVNIDENDKEKYSLDNNDVSSSFRNNSSLSNSTLHLGKLFSPRQSLDICSSNDGVNNSTFSSSIHRINISIGNNTTKDENKVFTSATSETNDKSDVSTVMSDFNKASECVNIDENDKEKCSLDNNDVSNSFRNNSSLLDSTLHLGKLFSPKQSLDICSSNDGVSNSTFSSPIHRINISIGNNTTKDENKVFTSATSETNDKSDVSTVMSDFNKASEWINIDENDKEKCSIDNNDFSNSSRKNSSLSDSTLHLGKLFSSKQSLDSCSTNDGDSDSTFFPTILGNKISVGNNSTTEEENKVFTFTTSETDDKSVVSSAMSGIEKGFKLVHIDENDSEKCLSLSKFNTSNLSLKAFNVDESLDFMDETCIQSHSDDDRKRNVASTDLTSLTDMNEQNVSKDKITCVQDVESCINEDCINLSKTFSINSSNKLEVTLDYTCKPDVMGEETLALCHSSIKKDSMSPSCKLFLDPSLTSMSIDESLVNGINNIPYKPAQEANLDLISKSPVTEGINFEDSDCERVCNNSNSTNLFNEVSGCALDYTCSKSVGMNETLTDNISETSITVIYGCSNNEQQDINRSSSLLIGCDEPFTEGNANLKNKHVFKLKENAVLEPEKTSDLYDLSDLKNSFISNKTFSAEEVNFLKENLLKVMELLKTDNNSFESYKLSSENEKCELLEKIKYLESNLIMKNESCADLLNSEEKINQLRNNNIISEEFSKIQRQYNNLLQLVLVTEADWTENKLFTNFLSDLNIAQNELFIPITEGSNGYVINHKKIYDVMLSLLKEIAKSNLIKEEYNNILRIYGGCNKDKNTSHIIGKECENDIIGNLMTTFEEISNRKNYLENENTELKIEVGNKSDEIKMLISTIEDLNLKLSIKESNVAYENSITMESHDTRKTTYDLSREVAEKLIFHDKLDDSNANVSNLKESLTTLKNTLLLSEKNYNDVNLKCENYKVELQKMHELEKVYQKLLLNYNALKMDFDTKCCEIEKLNADNQNLISYVDELKCKYDTDCDKSDFNIRFETTQKSLDELGDNQNRMLASNGSTSKNLSFKNNEIALLPYDSEEKLQKEYEMSENNLSLKENMVKLEKNCDSLEIHYDSSTNELSKLQLDLNDLNEKYSELVSNFNLYKHTYTRTEDECILMKEEKQTLESELNSLKCTLEGALEESSKLKSEKEEINIKLENLLIELSDLGTTNSNLMTQLSAVQTGSDHGMDLLKNEISELELKFEASENLLRDQENKNSELKASYDKVIEDLESKNSELSLLVDSKERLEKELELLSQNEALLQQKMVEMQEDRNGLEIQFHSSKDVVSKLQSDLNNLNEKYSEMIFDYDLYKQTYTRREDDCILLKEEKQILESKMDSLKSKLDSALEDSSKLKSDKEEINIKLENLLIQLSDLETTNSNLITQLSAVQSGSDHGMDLLKNEISELKLKFEDTENLLRDQENKHSELKASYDKVIEDLESKNSELSLLVGSKERLEEELELLSQNEALLQQKMAEMQEDRNGLEIQFQSSKDEVSKLESDLSHLTEKYSETISDFNLYKQSYTCTEDECILMKEEKQTLESELNSLKCTLEGVLEESSKLKSDKEEINIKLENLLIQLSDLETTNSNLITQLSAVQSGSDHGMDLLKNEISELKLKFEDTENLLRDQENKHSALKASYDKVIEDLESKNSELSLLVGSKERLEKELELLSQNEALLQQKMVEMQEDRNGLEIQFQSSKDEVSKLESDLSHLTEKYSETISDFNLYKQSYTCTEDECILMKEEKQTLESELNSLKCTLEGALEESSKLKSDKEEINIKLENLLIQLSDLETTNSNLITQLSAVQSGSDHDMDLLKNEISELKIKFEDSENIFMEHEKEHSELKASYDKLCMDLESKNCELSLIADSKVKLEKELELLNQNEILLKQKMVEMQEDRNVLEVQYQSSKDEVSKLESDLSHLTEKYSEMISDFDLYKQTFTCTEEEFKSMKEEKQSLESELNSLKCTLEGALEESSKLKLDKEEIKNNLKIMENQLSEEKKSTRDIQNCYENLKTQYDESVVEINNKTMELQNILAQLSDLETTNSNLITQLSGIQSDSDHNINLLNNEISQLKLKFEDTENLLRDQENKNSELKASYDKVCEDLESKNSKLSLLADSTEQLTKELELLNQNEALLKQKMVEMQEDRDSLEVQYHSSKDEVSKLQSDFNNLNEKYSEMISDFDLYKQTYICPEDECILMKEEKLTLESELNSLKCTLESALEESSKLKLDKEEINNNLKSMENQLFNEKQSTRDIQNSYENLKTKYDESAIELNKKTIELQNLLIQLTDLETTNGNLKNELSCLSNDSENRLDLINQEVFELKRKCETSEKLVVDLEEINSELKVSYNKICEDFEGSRAELSSLADSKEQLMKELELLNQNEILLKQKMVEMQEDRDSLEVQYRSSKDEVSKLQSDFNNLNEKYSEMISDFDLYKQTYTHTEDECILMKEEKLTLESELNSLKCTLESAREESSKLKSDKEEVNNNLKSMENQLSEEKQSTRDIKNSYENLITKYDESVIEINKKTIELQNLLIQLTDLETTNGNLKNELSCLRNDSENRLDIINQEVFELKRKCETSDKLLVDLEEINSELKVSYDKVCEDLKSRNSDLLLLADSKEKLEKELEVLNENEALLKQKLIDLEKNVDSHERALSDVNVELDSAYSKIDYIKKIEMQLGVLKDEYDILSLYWTHNNEIGGEKPFCLFSEFVFAVKAIIKDLIFFKTKCSEEEMKLSSSQEEVSRLNILLDSLKGEVKLTAEESGKLQENYSSLSKQYNSLLDANKDLNIRCNSLLEKLKELENNNSLCKSSVQDLKSEVASKESIIASLSNIKDLYESTVKEKETLSSQLMEKIEEYESVLDKFKKSEDNYLSLKLEYNTLTNEINNLRNTNETLEMKCNENYVLYMNSKDNIEILQKEKEEIRKNFIKCEKDYQNSLDLVKKCQENMGNLDKQYNLSIAKLNVILKEKESYESQNLSLQKINDDLVNRIKELNCKCLENQNMLIKFRELEKSYEAVCCKHKYLEKKLIDYENLKRENDILKTRVSEKDSFSNNLSLNFNALNEKYNSLSDEFKSLSTGVMTLLPDENSAMEIIKVVGEKLQVLKKIENDLQEEKIKCENLDEECNLLNEDLKYKDVVIGDMYKDHSSQVNELKESLKKEENLRQEILLENSTLKDKIRCLDLEIIKLKTTEQSPCSSCAELKGILQKLKMDLVDNSSKVTTLQLQIEENEITNKKKIHDYRKKISSLQEELGAALNKLEDNRLKNEVACLNAYAQTESLPIQISGQSGIVQSFKIKEQEERIQKFEKENLVLKRMCQSRQQTIQELKSKLESVSRPQKTQRNVLEEVQNHQTS